MESSGGVSSGLLCSAKTSAVRKMDQCRFEFKYFSAVREEACSVLCEAKTLMFGFQIAWRRNIHSVLVVWELLRDGLQFMNVVARRRTAVAAEVLFLRKQLAYYQDHQIPGRSCVGDSLSDRCCCGSTQNHRELCS